jgi:hypothetical protein
MSHAIDWSNLKQQVSIDPVAEMIGIKPQKECVALSDGAGRTDASPKVIANHRASSF